MPSPVALFTGVSYTSIEMIGQSVAVVKTGTRLYRGTPMQKDGYEDEDQLEE